MTSRHQSQRGVSLVELLVAVVVGLLLLGGLIQVYLSNKQSYNAQEQLARMQESGRFAMDMITSDLRRAGYWGGIILRNETDGAEIGAHACDTASDSWGRMVGWRISGLNDKNAGYEGCATDYLRGDVLAIRYADANPVALSNDRVYLTARTQPPEGWIITGSEFAGLPAVPPESAYLWATLPLVSNAYYVGASESTCRGTAVPALWRVGLNAANTRPEAFEMVPGVEQFQVRYLLDGAYVDADTVDASLQANPWSQVRAVRIWLLVRAECPEPGLQNTTTYAMGDTPFVANDNFRRQLYVSTVMLRNARVR